MSMIKCRWPDACSAYTASWPIAFSGMTALFARVTPAAGLPIAIPVLVAYQYLTHRVDALVDEMDEMGAAFMHAYVYKTGTPAAKESA